MTPNDIRKATAGLTAWLDGPFQEQRPELEKMRERLETATKRLTKTLLDVEEAMAERWPGRAAAIEMDANHVLLFSPWGRRSQLLVLRCRTKEIQPIQNMSRGIRTAAVAFLEDLAEQLQYEEEHEGSNPPHPA